MNLAATMMQVLSERLGLSSELLGLVVMERALNIVLGKPGPGDRKERVARLLQGKGEEWERLVDEIIVPETWFFRGTEPFRFLACYLKDEWRPTNPTGPFQVLCIPCASGEEPYSVAITALDAGLEAERIRIDAGDVSERTLTQARRAVYGRSSFREKCGRQEGKYFLPCSDGQRVRGDVAALVRFEKANLLDLSVYRSRAPYHVVFCRNAMIYLEEQARPEVMAGLHDLLHEDGLLFTGHSELIPFLQAGFRPVDSPQSFACRKERPVREVTAEAAPAILRSRKSVPITSAKAVKPLRVPQSDAPTPPGIEEAERLADRGQLAAAAAICERLLAGGTRDTDIYCLLGVINESGGQLDAAEDLFRKALFLDPHHYHSLVHMSLLCERRGDARGSCLHRARAERVFSGQQGEAAA